MNKRRQRLEPGAYYAKVASVTTKDGKTVLKIATSPLLKIPNPN